MVGRGWCKAHPSYRVQGVAVIRDTGETIMSRRARVAVVGFRWAFRV